MPKRKKHKIELSKEKKGQPAFASFLRRFYKPAAVVCGVVVFFLTYNAYVVDSSMVDIQFAIEQAAAAQNIDELKGLDMVLNTVVLKELAPVRHDSENLMNLDFASNITKKAQILKQADDARFMLSEVLKKKKKSRNRILAVLDAINHKVIKTGEDIRDALVKTTIKVVGLDEKAVLKAKELEEKQDLEGAVRAYEDALKEAPQYQGIEKIRLAFIYQRTGNFDKAKILYKDIIKNAPGSDAAYLARRLFDNLKDIKGFVRKKKELEEQILNELSTEKLQQLHYELGAIKSLLADFTGAEAAYKKAVELDPKTYISQKARFNLGFDYKMQSKFTDSDDAFRQISEEFPQAELAADSDYWIADSLRGQGRYEEALEKFQEIAQRFKDKPHAAMALFNTGQTCLYDLKDPQRAAMFFGTLRQDFEQSDVARHAASNISFDLGSVYRDEGFKLILQGRIKEAELKFNEALKLNPADAFAHSGLGAIKGLMQQIEEGLEKAKKAVELAPQNGYTNANLGFIYILNNDYSEATKVYEKAVSLSPEYGEAHYNLGWLYQNQGQFKKAIDAYREAIKHRPNLAIAHNNLGACYWNMDKIKEATDEFAMAVQLDSSLAEAHYNYGLMHLLFGRLKQAEAEMLKTLDLTRDIPEVEKLLNTIRQKTQEKQ